MNVAGPIIFKRSWKIKIVFWARVFGGIGILATAGYFGLREETGAASNEKAEFSQEK